MPKDQVFACGCEGTGHDESGRPRKSSVTKELARKTPQEEGKLEISILLVSWGCVAGIPSARRRRGKLT